MENFWVMTRLRKLNMLAIMQKQKWASFLLSMHGCYSWTKPFSFMYLLFINKLFMYKAMIKPFVQDFKYHA